MPHVTLRRAARLLGILFLALPLPALQEEPAPAGEEPVVHMGRAFLFRAELEQARAARWLDPALSDEEALERTRHLLRERLRMAGRFVEAQVHLEEDGHLSVVFVGKQDPRIEEFLVAGISAPGRAAIALVARDADVAGSSLEEERARLATWRTAHPDRPLAFFHERSREEGGPHDAIQWLERREPGARPVAVLRAPALSVSRQEAEQLYASPNAEGEEESYSLLFALLPEFGERLHAFHAEHADRERALLLDEHVLAVEPIAPLVTEEPPAEPRLRLPGALTLLEVRAAVFSVMGEPLPARLVFQGFGLRPLEHVKPRES